MSECPILPFCPLLERPENLEKLAARIAKSKKPVVLNEPRPGPARKLLVLDIDYTLFDHR